MTETEKTVVINNVTLAILCSKTRSFRVLKTFNMSIPNKDGLSLNSSDEVREAIPQDFYRFQVQYHHSYLINNDNYDGNEWTDDDIKDAIHAGCENYLDLKDDATRGDGLSVYKVKYKNGVELKSTADNLFHSILNDYEKAQWVVSYHPQ